MKWKNYIVLFAAVYSFSFSIFAQDEDQGFGKSERLSFEEKLPNFGLFANEHFEIAAKYLDAHRELLTNGSKPIDAESAVKLAASIAGGIMNDTGFPVGIPVIIKLPSMPATASMPIPAIYSVRYQSHKSILKRDNEVVRVEIVQKPDVVDLTRRILDQIADWACNNYYTVLPILSEDLQHRVTIIRIKSNPSYSPLPEKLSFKDFAQHPFFSNTFSKLSKTQKNAVEHIFKDRGEHLTIPVFIASLNNLPRQSERLKSLAKVLKLFWQVQDKYYRSKHCAGALL